MQELKFEDLPKATTLLLRKIESLESELKLIKDNLQPKEPLELMTRQEVGDFFKVNLSTVWQWTKSGRLKAYGIGSRVYYKRLEIENVLISINH